MSLPQMSFLAEPPIAPLSFNQGYMDIYVLVVTRLSLTFAMKRGLCNYRLSQLFSFFCLSLLPLSTLPFLMFVCIVIVFLVCIVFHLFALSLLFIHSFINLYSTPSRGLLRGAP